MTFEPKLLRPYIRLMTRIAALTLTACLAASSALAEDEDNGKSLMEQGAELFFEGLRQEMEPALDNLLGMAEEFGPSMRSFFEEMGPALAELAGQVQDWSAYEMPKMLPNGDIIIRKKAKPEEPEDAPAEDEAPEGTTDI
ncbi:hypothetical protein [Ruegeria sp. HKCCD8929]|uniref:hypothetical protein n=1 Tax=Ruegeria sp. HKCCD8929 TaxID=2683006 RepID=UPI0020C23E82|nr:hypothetical protein [Ruegeria sp. HKCCD8929]